MSSDVCNPVHQRVSPVHFGIQSIRATKLTHSPTDSLCFTVEPCNEPAYRGDWYRACATVADSFAASVPETYRSRTFSGIIGDIKALSAKQALSLYSRKKGLGRQYAAQYLRTGIDEGNGYQACAATALSEAIYALRPGLIGSGILDVGCAVGVTAGVLGLERVTGFDLFADLLHAARAVDRLTGRQHAYTVADMTRNWPFGECFDTVICGLVCHHLKTQTDTARFFTNANRVLAPGGVLVVTLPAGTLATVVQIESLIGGLESFGFEVDIAVSGLMVSDDDPRSLFWMFQFVAIKQGPPQSEVFIDNSFAFPAYRTPVTRVVKGERARQTVTSDRQVSHTRFRLVPVTMLPIALEGDNRPFIYEQVARLTAVI